jgi:hypothetical protein
MEGLLKELFKQMLLLMQVNFIFCSNIFQSSYELLDSRSFLSIKWRRSDVFSSGHHIKVYHHYFLLSLRDV